MASLPAWVTIANVSELAKVAALAVGGWWTWKLFVRQRTGVARANLTQAVKDWSLTTTRRLVRVDVTIENKGTTPIRPRSAEIVVYQVRPATDAGLDALLAARLALILPASVQAVDVWSRVDCGARYQDLYWDITTLQPLT